MASLWWGRDQPCQKNQPRSLSSLTHTKERDGLSSWRKTSDFNNASWSWSLLLVAALWEISSSHCVPRDTQRDTMRRDRGQRMISLSQASNVETWTRYWPIASPNPNQQHHPNSNITTTTEWRCHCNERDNQSMNEREACNDEGLSHLYHAFIACIARWKSRTRSRKRNNERERERIETPRWRAGLSVRVSCQSNPCNGMEREIPKARSGVERVRHAPKAEWWHSHHSLIDWFNRLKQAELFAQRPLLSCTEEPQTCT